MLGRLSASRASVPAGRSERSVAALPFGSCAGVSARPVSRSPHWHSAPCCGATPSTATRPATTCARSSRPAATSSTRHTATAAATPRPSSAGCSTARSPRDDVVICTKAGISRSGGQRRVDVSRRGLMSQLETSLRRLGTDHVDLWLVHTWSDDVPLSETLSALEWAAASGRARYVGVSNYSGWQSARAFSLLESARIPMVANEIEYSLVCRTPEHEVTPAATSLGFGLLPWSPLGRGVLTGQVPQRHTVGVPGRVRPTSRASPSASSTSRRRRVADAVAMAARGLGGQAGRGGAGLGARPSRRRRAHRRRADARTAAVRAREPRARAALGDRRRAGRRLGLAVLTGDVGQSVDRAAGSRRLSGAGGDCRRGARRAGLLVWLLRCRSGGRRPSRRPWCGGSARSCRWSAAGTGGFACA